MYKTAWFGLATIHILSNSISTLTCNDIKANWINFKTNIIYNQWIVSKWNVVMQCHVVSFSGLLQWKSSFYTFCLSPPSEVKNPSDRVGHLKWFYYFLYFDLSEIIARYLPVTPALPVTSASGPLPLNYSRPIYDQCSSRYNHLFYDST